MEIAGKKLQLTKLKQKKRETPLKKNYKNILLYQNNGKKLKFNSSKKKNNSIQMLSKI